jgi:hypothetical protein
VIDMALHMHEASGPGKCYSLFTYTRQFAKAARSPRPSAITHPDTRLRGNPRNAGAPAQSLPTMPRQNRRLISSHGGEVMAAKRPNPVSKAVAVLFSSLVAPLIVNITASTLKLDGSRPAPEPAGLTVKASAPADVPNVRLLPPATVTPSANDLPPAPAKGPLAWRPAS